MAVERGTVVVHRALADASRVRILEELRGGPLDVPNLAERVGLHPNTIRSHLEVLGQAGMVISGPEKRDRPGRPRIVYQLAADIEPPVEAGYRLLAKILTSYLAGASPEPSRSAEEAGFAWGRYLADRPPPFAKLPESEALSRVVKLLADLDFAPEAVNVAGRQEIRLHRCPFREAAEANREVVCAVHLGLIKGALAEMGAPLAAERLEPFVTPSLCVALLAPGATARGDRPD